MNNDTYDMLSKRHLFAKSSAGANKFHCPNCGKNDFEVKPSDGTYTCWSGGCSTKDIRVAIDELEGKTFDPKSKTVDRPIKSTRSKAETHHYYPNRDGSDLVRTTRVDDGNGGKNFYQSHWNGFAWVKGNPAEFKASTPIYRYADVRQSIADGKLIFIVEGESCVNALWSIGIPATTTIGGAGKFSKYGDYSADFDGGKFILAPDCDAVGVKHMAEVCQFLGDKVQGYYLAGSNPDLWVDPCGGFDIGDDIVDRHLDRDRILASVISADKYRSILSPEPKKPVGRPRKPPTTPIDRDYQALAEKLGIDLPESGCDADGMPLSKLVKLELDLLAIYGDRLEFNEMSCEIELDRLPIDMDSTKSFIAESNLGDRSQQDCDIALGRIAKLNRYSPVRDYLNSVRGKASQDFIASVPFRYWGNDSELQNYLFFKKLIACVARVMQPGCADHNLLILNGGQGAHKSMALSILSGEEWFTDDLRSIDDKDELAKLSRFWILELAEVDYLFGRKETELFKRFLSGRKDTFRPPYGRSNVIKDRTSALFATTNKSEFLSDPTGSRRYWVVDVGQRIDTDRLAIDRDLIWSAALDAYESSVQWWLEDEIDLDNQQANKSYQEVDMLQDLIENNLANVLIQQGSIEYTTVNAIADRILNFATDKQDRKLSVRIVAILRPLGFESKKIRIDGDQKKVWARSMVELSSVPNKKDEYQDEYHLNSLPTTNNTYSTYGTYSYIEESKKIKNKNENKIINNLFLESDEHQVPCTNVPNNTQNQSQSHLAAGTKENDGTQPKQGDRVKITETHHMGTVASIFRLDDSGTIRLQITLDNGSTVHKYPYEVERIE